MQKDCLKHNKDFWGDKYWIGKALRKGFNKKRQEGKQAEKKNTARANKQHIIFDHSAFGEALYFIK